MVTTATTGISAQHRPLTREVDHATLDTRQLARVWTALCPDVPVAEFRDYSAAVRRIDRLLRERGLALVDHVPHRALSRHVTIFPHRLHAVPRDTLPETPVPPRTATRWRDELVCVLQVSHNPKKPGTPSHARFAQRQPRQTIRQYRLALMRAGLSVVHSRGDCIYDWERGYIRIYEPDGTEVLPTHPFRWQKHQSAPPGGG